jgi:hypothetical protein
MHSPSPIQNQPHSIEPPELIDRLAEEMRASGDRDLPHAFYVEQVKRKLAGQRTQLASFAVNDEAALSKKTPIPAATSSVFQCWAMPE